jgi:hypothetical protein
VIYGVPGRVLQQGADDGEVRDYPVEGKGGARVELTMGREMAARRREDGAGGDGPVARRGHKAEERKGGVHSCGRLRRKMRRGGKWGAVVTWRPFKQVQRGGGMVCRRCHATMRSGEGHGGQRGG